MKLYRELAHWWPLLSPPDEYEEEAAFYGNTLLAACKPPGRTLLELGSGGGNNASFLCRRFEEVVLVELAPGMLEVSHALNPELEHVLGDMRDVRLNREFDCVFIHDAIDYMTSLTDLRRAFETAYVHLRPGGAALFAPDHLCETFAPSTDSGGSDGADRALRYLEWTWDPDPADSTAVTDYVYALRDADGSVQIEHDRHVHGLFPRSEWLRLLAEVGFRETRVVPFVHSDVEPGTHELFVATKAEK